MLKLPFFIDQFLNPLLFFWRTFELLFLRRVKRPLNIFGGLEFFEERCDFGGALSLGLFGLLMGFLDLARFVHFA